MAEQDSDLSENATPYKLEEARKQGNVAKSADFTAVVVLSSMVATLYASGWDGLKQSTRLLQSVLARVGKVDWSVDATSSWLGQLILSCLHILSPLFLALAVTAVMVSLFQTGPIFSFKPISPDLNRINPTTGFKRLFSIRTIYESGKSIVKLLVLGTVVYSAIHHEIPGLISLSGLEPKAYAQILVGLTANILVKLIFALLIVAVIDFAYTKWEFGKKMRMSKRDIRDESKNREGDPRIRSRIRELRKEMLKRSKAIQNVPKADVLITNPTRIAVALSYKHGGSGAPQLIAKGAGDLAAKMRQIATLHHIPIIQNKLLARTLFREVDFEGYVPEKLYPQLAKIMVWIYTMREARKTNGMMS